jgi:hypothetical protein
MKLVSGIQSVGLPGCEVLREPIDPRQANEVAEVAFVYLLFLLFYIVFLGQEERAPFSQGAEDRVQSGIILLKQC